MSGRPSDLQAVLKSVADAHDYFGRNADLRMTTGDHARQAKRLNELLAALAPVTPAEPKGLGIASTVAWTELHNAIMQDGIDVTQGKCGPAVRAWIVDLVRGEFVTPASGSTELARAGRRFAPERKFTIGAFRFKNKPDDYWTACPVDHLPAWNGNQFVETTRVTFEHPTQYRLLAQMTDALTPSRDQGEGS